MRRLIYLRSKEIQQRRQNSELCCWRKIKTGHPYITVIPPFGICLCSFEQFGGFGMEPFMAAAIAQEMGRSEKPLKAAFSNAGLQESHVHNVQITRESPNYRIG